MTQAYVKIEEFWAVEAERDRLASKNDEREARATRQMNTIASLQGETASLARENERLKIELGNARAARDTEVAVLAAKLRNAEQGLVDEGLENALDQAMYFGLGDSFDQPLGAIAESAKQVCLALRARGAK